MVNELIMNFRVLTPLYLGGAHMAAELRAPGFKGPLRYWYRAVDPGFSSLWDNGGFKEITSEERLFGGCRDKAGQCPFFIRVFSKPFAEFVWKKNEVARYNKGKGPDTINGFSYLGYPFGLKNNKGINSDLRKAVAPNHTFTVRCFIPPKNNHQELRRALTASWWCLGHLGGVGSRSRRGFGSLELTGWETVPDTWPELSQLSVLSESSSPDKWQEGLVKALKTMSGWFGHFDGKNLHPHLGNNCRIKLLSNAFSLNEWGKAMAHMGELMQRFRKKYDADKRAVRSHLMALDKKGGEYLDQAPDRTTFGLPLTFRFKGIRNSLEFVPYDAENYSTLGRHGSLLHMRLVTIRDWLYPLFVRLSGDVPGIKPVATIKNHKRPLRRPGQNAMDMFLTTLH
jgi:CRISPR-associated protein Cmr1